MNKFKKEFTMDAKIWNFSGWVEITDPHKLKNGCSDMLYGAGFNVLNFVEHGFEPQGYTALWLLGESHFAVHSFPEHGKTYFELSSCNEEKHNYFMNNFWKVTR